MARITLKQRIREIWQKLKHLNATPDQIAAGFCIGIFASLLPLNPSPTITAIVVAWLLKRNVMAAVAGAVISILYLPLLPLIWLAEFRLGKLILPVQHPLTLDQPTTVGRFATGLGCLRRHVRWLDPHRHPRYVAHLLGRQTARREME